MQYQSERLIFREFTKDDFALFYSVFSNELVMNYALIDKFETKESILPYFNKVLANNETIKDRKAYEYAIFHKDSNEFIGFADVEIYIQNSHGGNGEIGYFMLPEHWGKGYATEIATTMLTICFNHIKLHRVCASCNINNKSSENIMKKIGMKKEGVFKKARFKHGEWVDELRYSILIEEWKSQNETTN